MASRTQLRLQQITGSIGNAEGKIRTDVAASAIANVLATDLTGSLSMIASALGRIHGKGSNEAFGNDTGKFYATLKSDSTGNVDIGSTTDADKFGDIFVGDGKGLQLGAAEEHKIIDGAPGLLIDTTEVLELNSSGGAISIGNDANAQNINIGTGAAARTITMGNVSGATAVAVNAGTGGVALASTGAGDITINSDDTLLLDADGVLELNSSAGAISIGNDANAQAINVGTGAAARTITVGNATGATALILSGGTGGIKLDAVDAGSINIGTSTEAEADASPINIGTSGARTITIGNSSATLNFESSTSTTNFTAGDVVITNSLIVKGATTMLTSSNTVIQDPIIGIGVSGSEGYTPDGFDVGIIFGQGDIGTYQRALFYDDDLDKFVLSKADASPTSSSFGIPLQANLLELTTGKMSFAVDSAEYVSGDGTDLTVGSGADIKLTAATFVEIPASIPLTFDGTDHDDKISSDGTDMTIAVGGGDIVLDASDDIIIDAGGDMIDFKKGGTLHGSFDMSGAGDLIVKDAGGTEIFRIDGSADSLLMAGTKKIEFQDAGTYIHSNADGDLDLVSDGTNADSINVESAGGITLDAGNAAHGVTYEDDGTSLLRISHNSTDLMLESLVQDKDMIFRVNDNTTQTEVFRLDGDVSAFRMASTKEMHFGSDRALIYRGGAEGKLIISGSATAQDAIKLNASDGGITLAGGSQNEDIYIENSPVKLEQISAPSSNGDKLYNVGGDLYWAGEVIGGASIKRAIFNVTGALGVGTEVALTGSGAVYNKILEKLDSSDDISFHGTDTFAKRGRETEVYVNGQLLVSGSGAQVAAGTRDYVCTSTTKVKFAFNLELDDILQVITR